MSNSVFNYSAVLFLTQHKRVAGGLFTLRKAHLLTLTDQNMKFKKSEAIEVIDLDLKLDHKMKWENKSRADGGSNERVGEYHQKRRKYGIYCKKHFIYHCLYTISSNTYQYNCNCT